MMLPQRAPGDRSLQVYFLNRIQERLPSNLLLVDQISSLLGISTDSAYRRLRGETALTLDEAGKLARHFKVPLQDGADEGSDAVAFNKVSINALPGGFGEYLSTTLSLFEGISRAKDKRGIYAAKDIPLFYYFLFPELARFKLMFWLKTIKQGDALPGLLSPEPVPEDYLSVATAIAQVYLRIPFTEIWNDETVNSTLRQIEYYHEAGLFTEPGAAGKLLKQLEVLIRHIQQQAIQGVKLFQQTRYAAYALYYNEVILLDNTIFTVADGVRCTLFSYNGIDYLRTSDAAFCGEVEQWLSAQMEKSTVLSRSSEKERNRFFNKICNRIQELQRKLSAAQA